MGASSDGSARELTGSASVTPATAVPNPLRDQGRLSRLPPIPGTPQNPRDLAVRLALQRRNVRKILDPVEIVAPGPPRLCIGDRPAFGFVHREGSRQRAQFCAGRACPPRHPAARCHATVSTRVWMEARTKRRTAPLRFSAIIGKRAQLFALVEFFGGRDRSSQSMSSTTVSGGVA
jgi:hypothetical protein